MRKIRKVLAFILLLALSVTALTACGSKDDEKEQEKKPKIVKGSLKDMMDEIQKTESGTLHMEITFDTPSKSGEDQGGKMELDYEFDKKNSESSMSLKLSINAGNEKINFGPVDLLREKNEKLYFNLGIINEIAKAAKSENRLGDRLSDLDGWFMLPLPSDLPEYKAPAEDELLGSFVTDLFKELPQESVDGNYRISLKTKDNYIALVNAFKSLVQGDYKSVILKSYERDNVLTQIDINKYVADLIDTYIDDIREVVREYGETMDVTESQLEELLREAKKQDYAKLLDEFMQKERGVSIFEKPTSEEIEESLNEYVNSLDEMIESLSRDEDGDYPDTEIRFYADDSAYNVEISSSAVQNDGGNIVIKVSLEPGKVSVKAPDKNVTIKQIADVLFDSYSSYVDKSRMAQDVASVDEIMMAAEKVACDVEVNAQVGEQFIVTFDKGSVSISAIDTSGNKDQIACDIWKEITFYGSDSYAARSEVLKKASGQLVGTVQENGSLEWKITEADENLREFLKYSKDFAYKYDLK
ncbi:MAG: hypothetical protein J5649_04490 [Lachnospiraceae bacterium]|nr:hypothetical protein [Lachnospiraceae bacterium]